MGTLTAAERARRNVNAQLANPLAGISHTMLQKMEAQYVRKHQESGDQDDIGAFSKGAVLAQDPLKYQSVAGLTEEERMVLHKEDHLQWHQTPLLYIFIVVCSTRRCSRGGYSFIPQKYDQSANKFQMKPSCQFSPIYFHSWLFSSKKGYRNGYSSSTSSNSVLAAMTLDLPA